MIQSLHQLADITGFEMWIFWNDRNSIPLEKEDSGCPKY